MRKTLCGITAALLAAIIAFQAIPITMAADTENEGYNPYEGITDFDETGGEGVDVEWIRSVADLEF